MARYRKYKRYGFRRRFRRGYIGFRRRFRSYRTRFRTVYRTRFVGRRSGGGRGVFLGMSTQTLVLVAALIAVVIWQWKAIKKFFDKMFNKRR